MAKRKNGEGSFEKLESGKIRMRKQVGILNNGRPKIFTVTGTSETDCIRKMRYKENSNNSHVDSSSIKNYTLSDLCMKHLEEHLDEKDRLKPKAADRRESTIRNQIKPYKIGRMQVTAVDSSDVRNHIELLIIEGKLSVSSILKTLDVINAAYKWAQNQNYISYNPCNPVLESLKKRLKKLDEKKSSEGYVVVLSELQIKQLHANVFEMIKTAKAHRCNWGLSILLLLYTGIRIGELCALRWSDWSRKTNTLNILKTRNIAKNRKSKGKGDTYIPNENEVKNLHSRTIKLSDKAVEVLSFMYELSPQRDLDSYILFNELLKPTNPSNYDTNINKLYRELEVPKDVTGAHILRRTCATSMYNDGCRIEEIAAYLGDTPETILKHYVSLTKRIVADGEILNVVELPRKR